MLHAVPHAESSPHRGHLAVKLLSSDLMVKAQPAELDLHTEGDRERDREREREGERGRKGAGEEEKTEQRMRQNPGE